MCLNLVVQEWYGSSSAILESVSTRKKNKGKKQMVAKFYNTTRKSLRISYKINVFF